MKNKTTHNDNLLGVVFSLCAHLVLIVGMIGFSKNGSPKKEYVIKKGFGTLPVVVYSPESLSSSKNNKNEVALPKAKPDQKGLVFNDESKSQPLPRVHSTGSVYYPAGIPNGVDSQLAKDPREYNSDMAASVQEIISDDEYVYSPFFSRLKENLYPVWARKVRRDIDEYDLVGREAAKTVMQVKVNEQGEIQESYQLESSGCLKCDEVAQEALLTLGNVQNPPTSLRDKDGLYSFKLSFTIYTQYSSSFIRFEPLYPNAR
jgi:hypothetical protein